MSDLERNENSNKINVIKITKRIGANENVSTKLKTFVDVIPYRASCGRLPAKRRRQMKLPARTVK